MRRSHSRASTRVCCGAIRRACSSAFGLPDECATRSGLPIPPSRRDALGQCRSDPMTPGLFGVLAVGEHADAEPALWPELSRPRSPSGFSNWDASSHKREWSACHIRLRPTTRHMVTSSVALRALFVANSTQIGGRLTWPDLASRSGVGPASRPWRARSGANRPRPWRNGRCRACGASANSTTGGPARVRGRR